MEKTVDVHVEYTLGEVLEALADPKNLKYFKEQTRSEKVTVCGEVIGKDGERYVINANF